MQGPLGQMGGESCLPGTGYAKVDVEHMGVLGAEEGAEKEREIKDTKRQ